MGGGGGAAADAPDPPVDPTMGRMEINADRLPLDGGDEQSPEGLPNAKSRVSEIFGKIKERGPYTPRGRKEASKIAKREVLKMIDEGRVSPADEEALFKAFKTQDMKKVLDILDMANFVDDFPVPSDRNMGPLGD